jgi:hypothetical protein
VDTSLIVFAVGTAASFAPMYWIASRLMGRRRISAKVGARAPAANRDPAGRGEFMDLLRQEAARPRSLALWMSKNYVWPGHAGWHAPGRPKAGKVFQQPFSPDCPAAPCALAAFLNKAKAKTKA